MGFRIRFSLEISWAYDRQARPMVSCFIKFRGISAK